jgi:uncharacterized membrane protein
LTEKSPVPPSRLIGLFYILLSAAGFGAMPIFAKLAYAEGVDFSTLLFLRFALAGGLMAAIMFVRNLDWPSGKPLWLLIAMGSIGYVGQAFCYFAALQYATAGLTALLLYLYPVIVTLISAWFMRRRLSRLRMVAVCAALFGTGLAVGDSLDGSTLGIALGIGWRCSVRCSRHAVGSSCLWERARLARVLAARLDRRLGGSGQYCLVFHRAGYRRLFCRHATPGSGRYREPVNTRTHYYRIACRYFSGGDHRRVASCRRHDHPECSGYARSRFPATPPGSS